MLRGPQGWSQPPTDLSTGLVAADMFQVSVPPVGFGWGKLGSILLPVGYC